VQIKLHRKIK